jgi:MoaA/NifB/PqqE/SkfB family radical SAM enzyme
MSLNFQATRFGCTWPREMLVMLCDGRIVCGCADPYATRVLGDTRVSSVQDVWRGPTITKLRGDLNEGGSDFCGDCALKRPFVPGETPTVRALDAGPFPGRMFIECTAACNISCPACCAPETRITKTRQAGCSFDLFRRVIDEVGPTLGRVVFNYGRRSCTSARSSVQMPQTALSAHLSLHEHERRGVDRRAGAAARASGIDEVTFSIDGARPGATCNTGAGVRRRDSKPRRDGRRAEGRA